MIKATTQNGSYYLIDTENMEFNRTVGVGRSSLGVEDGWYPYKYLSSYDWETNTILDTEIMVGKAMYFGLSNNDLAKCIISTDVVSLDEY